jgi:hypothetical protein
VKRRTTTLTVAGAAQAWRFCDHAPVSRLTRASRSSREHLKAAILTARERRSCMNFNVGMAFIAHD